MADYINKIDVINVIMNFFSNLDLDEADWYSFRLQREINELDSADVRENVLGYWDIHRGNWADEFECSVCHKISKTGGNYCFNCGADMREVQDG